MMPNMTNISIWGTTTSPTSFWRILTITPAVRNLPLGVWSLALQGLVTDVRKKHGPNSAQGLSRAFTARAWKPDFFSSDTSMVPTKSAIVLTAAARKKLDIVIAAEATIQSKTLTFRKAALYGAAGDGAAQNRLRRARMRWISMSSCLARALTCHSIGSLFRAIRQPWTSIRALGSNTAFPRAWESIWLLWDLPVPTLAEFRNVRKWSPAILRKLYKGNLQLPSDYDELALADAAAERACFPPHCGLQCAR